jgi:hypothetical protein
LPWVICTPNWFLKHICSSDIKKNSLARCMGS